MTRAQNQQQQHDPDRLDRRAAEAFLGTEGNPMPSGTMASMLHHRQVPHLRIGPRTVQFSRRELTAWLEEKRVAAVPGPRRRRKAQSPPVAQ